jgi:hypothetical protein
MATKKQKRAAALAKRTRYLNDMRISGLQAQALDQARRDVRDADQTVMDRYREILARHGIHE